MTDGDALYLAILANPEDDTPRLILADWLDDHGDGERAAYIRAAIEHARAGEAECVSPVSVTADPYHVIRCGACAFCTRIQYLEAAGRRHAPDLPIGYVWTHEENPNTVHSPGGNWPIVIFRRGFVDEIRCSLATWVGGECRRCTAGRRGRYIEQIDDPISQYTRWQDCPGCDGTGTTPAVGPGVVRAYPVTRVVIVGAEPVPPADPFMYWNWLPESHADTTDYPAAVLPDAFYRHHGEFPTRAAALDALSAAAISWGKCQTAAQPGA